MKRFFLVFLAFLLLAAGQVFAAAKVENDPVFIRIGKHEITLSEFVQAYQKNNNSMLAPQITPEEYLELFINFKLKVTEALALGLDTVTEFITELAGYREQLAKPYFSDQSVIEELTAEAYERSKYDIRASHILIRLNPKASPADTLAAFQRANTIRQRILSGEPFAKVAAEQSDDPSARDREVDAGRPPIKGNGGDLGYFTVFNMVYPFETVAFSLDVGEISKPVRSDFGYHIITVTDRLPAMGRARVAHIMAMFTPEMNSARELELKQSMELAHQKYQQGVNFADLVQQYSEDLSSRGNNGEMRPFTSREMVPEFIKAISTMSPGEVSPPVRTNFGWHLIKLLEKTPPQPWEAAYQALKSNVMQDSRAFLGEQVVVERLKNEYNFSVNIDALKEFNLIVDSTIFAGSWKADPAKKLETPLFSFAGLNFLQQDFANFLEMNQANRPPGSIETFVATMFDEMSKRKLLQHENGLLEKKFPAFKAIMREYHDGMLLFEITNQKVWNRAVQDTIGLEKFFAANQGNYTWPNRVRARVFEFESLSDAAEFKPKNYKPRSAEEGNAKNKEATTSKAEKFSSLTEGTFQRGQNSAVDQVNWKKGVAKPLRVGDKFFVVQILELLPKGNQKLGEVRGYVINDYQNYLDNQWIIELRQKYNVEVDKGLLKGLSN